MEQIRVIRNNQSRKIEILAVVITGILKFVLMDWLGLRLFYILGISIFWVFFIYKQHKKYPSILNEWGFKKENFVKSFLFLLPFAVVLISGILLYGVIVNAEFMNWHIIPIFVLYPVWGIIQQFMMVGIIAKSLSYISKENYQQWYVIIFTSLIFALVHYPSIPLMIFAFVLEINFIWVYFKWPNLWSLGLFHGWIGGLFLFFVLKRDLWNELWLIFN
ncbi:MAG: hypothetical protein R6U04_07450 [Bacteroidales bacterium]